MCHLCWVQVGGRGTFQVRITALSRTLGATGTVLSYNGTVPVCRTFARYCLTNYQRAEQLSVPFSGRCEYGETTSVVSSDCSPDSLDNSTVAMPFTFTWTVCN